MYICEYKNECSIEFSCFGCRCIIAPSCCRIIIFVAFLFTALYSCLLMRFSLYFYGCHGNGPAFFSTNVIISITYCSTINMQPNKHSLPVCTGWQTLELVFIFFLQFFLGFTWTFFLLLFSWIWYFVFKVGRIFYSYITFFIRFFIFFSVFWVGVKWDFCYCIWIRGTWIKVKGY